ncbi:nicotinate phosphoribosyltransferase [Saccharicrinis sp. FJH54]|uniref:nicotinate phosphoribosyltransferase n=1 Tax=Saccharicrinis sp. FJH54 TaxID=3344665 RepID=UPI0035D42C1A
MLIHNQANGLYTDHYELTMAQGYFLSGKYRQRASFDYFYRKNPFNGGFVSFSGLSTFLELLKDFRFSKDDCNYLLSVGFNSEFVKYLETFSFSGDIWSVNEGEVIFPNEPVVRIEGNLAETQLIETLLLNVLNFESLIATKANRMRMVAGERLLLEFGLRRAQGFGGILATKAAMNGGFDATSNVMGARLHEVPSTGTMAHSWIQSFNDELEAFRTYARIFPDNCILLVDTYNTLKSGVPNAIKIAEELKNIGKGLSGIRLDSGDLTYLSKQSRKMLDYAGFPEVKIVASNQLDEYIIQSLLTQGAPVDSFGIGTALVTGKDDAALDGVYKLAELDGTPTMKFSENISKMTLPGKKKIWRYYDNDGLFKCDAIVLNDEKDIQRMHHPVEPGKHLNLASFKREELMTMVVKHGNFLNNNTQSAEIAIFTKNRLNKLPEEYKRFLNPHVYKTGISDKLLQIRNKLTNRE